jgi:glc operon protein GlcG
MTSPSVSQAPPPDYGAPITLRDALIVVGAAEAEAIRLDRQVIVAVVDSGGHLVCLHRLDNAQFGSIPVAEAKAYSAIAFRRPTKAFEDSLALTPRVLALSAAVPIGGGMPLIANGRLVGAIGVSGATPQEDEAIAQAGAGALP